MPNEMLHYAQEYAQGDVVGFGGALVETTPFDRRVVGPNPVLAAK